MSATSKPNKRRLNLIIVLAVLVGAIILLLASEWGSITPEGTSDDPTTSGALDAPPENHAISTPAEVYNGTTPVRAFGAAGSIPPATGANRSLLADELNRPDWTADRDLEVVAELVANYQDLFHELPVGTNAEITAALAGDNMYGHAPLPTDHPAINAAGELTDRWGTPFFFHQLTAHRVEIRSAGPDRRMHNGDDFVWPRQDQETWVAAAAQLLGQAP